jgi:hypothetical protein
MEVIELTPGELVPWRVTDGPPEWIGTTIDWHPSRSDGATIVRFTHQGWAGPVEFLSPDSSKWAVFLLPQGPARPEPDSPPRTTSRPATGTEPVAQHAGAAGAAPACPSDPPRVETAHLEAPGSGPSCRGEGQ